MDYLRLNSVPFVYELFHWLKNPPQGSTTFPLTISLYFFKLISRAIMGSPPPPVSTIGSNWFKIYTFHFCTLVPKEGHAIRRFEESVPQLLHVVMEKPCVFAQHAMVEDIHDDFIQKRNFFIIGSWYVCGKFIVNSEVGFDHECLVASFKPWFRRWYN
jgi:hypothetical protein